MTAISSASVPALRRRLGHLSILVVFFALFVSLLIPAARMLGAIGILNPPLVLLLAAPWLLGALILLFERNSPVKFWAAPLLLSLIAPGLVICQNWLLIQSWPQTHSLAMLAGSLVSNVVLITCFTLFISEMCPTRCPECRKWCLIPLRKFWGPEARSTGTRYCGRCGLMFWKNSAGEWQRERRRTWADELLNQRGHQVADSGGISAKPKFAQKGVASKVPHGAPQGESKAGKLRL